MGEEFLSVLRAHAGRYPRMEPQDYGKLAYQSEFGPEHMAPERARCLAALLEEWRSAAGEGPPPSSPESIGNGLYRFHLAGGYAPEEAAPLLAELFLRTAAEHAGSAAGLAGRLDCLRALEAPGLDAWLEEYRRQGCPAVRHSAAFRTAYRPHYRVVGGAYACFFPALLAVRRLAEGGAPAIAAVDGRCGSGKTSLAEVIARLFPCNVFHMDDFYLPPERRRADWEAVPGGNMDFARLRREVLEPARAGRAVTWRAYDCRSGRLGPARTAPARALTVVEGSYSHHPDLGGAYGLSIFLTCSRREQARRLRAREGAYYPAFERRWIPLEEAYLRRFGVEAGSGVVLDTGGFFG